jgi:serine/threonine protein kinase
MRGRPEDSWQAGTAVMDRGLPELRLGDDFAGYRIEGVLGRGGMGVVYRVTDLRLERLAALKVIRPEVSADEQFRRRFYRESQLASSIRHPNVVTIYHAGEAAGVLYVTMELIRGVDLGALIANCGRLAPRLACEVLVQVADALDVAHEHGLVHRDVKPANVLIEDAAAVHAYLTDFGLTKRRASDDAITKSDVFLGTVGYAAPEQIRHEAVSTATDIYSLGCVLFAMLTGGPPFRRSSDVETMFAHLNDPAPRVSTSAHNVPPALDRLVERALAKDPNDRYSSAGEFAGAARAALRACAASVSFTFKRVEP